MTLTNTYTDTKKLIVISVAVISLIITLTLYYNSRPNNLPFSGDILYVTSPVYELTGIVKSADKTSLTVAYEGKTYTNASSRLLSKTILYTIALTAKTKIVRPVTLYENFASARREEPPRLTASDIQPGQKVVISTRSDLRLLKKPEFTADAVSLPQEQRSLAGMVTAVTEDTITVKASRLLNRAPYDQADRIEDKTVTFKVIGATAITRSLTNSQGRFDTVISLSDIRTGDTVMVLAAADINSQIPIADQIVKASPRPTPVTPTAFVTPFVVR